MIRALALAPLLAFAAACSDAPAPHETKRDKAAPPAPATAAPESAGSWDLASSDEGSGLFLTGMEAEVADRPRVHLFCASGGSKRLLVNVPAFTPIASEERLSFGAGGIVAALVADPAGDHLRGGVSGEGAMPTDLPQILRAPGGIGVSYGAQTLGPLPAIPQKLAGDFLQACLD